ncbi:HD domain-containing phosphohydrolase [Bacillus sp. FJAT-45037]|uniref:HD domain-containing phosphohydrolase n=1 Tax=Bacillus sp. FJAT-45037 TaxID=2011007 RepID=UPI000C2514DD|nr:HD domain-containing phosphohydrolase [Bacillus sp. FJAT-45037]
MGQLIHTNHSSDNEYDFNQIGFLFTMQEKVPEIDRLFNESLAAVMMYSVDQDFLLEDKLTLELADKMFQIILSHSTVKTSLLALKQKDNNTYYHSFHVFLLSAYLAKALEIDNIPLFLAGCLLHDIGKLFISDDILLKDSKLTWDEFTSMKEHSCFGQKWVAKNLAVSLIEELALSHHERMDGSGYPNQLTAEEIVYEVKCLMVIDVLSALTLSRAYREPISTHRALEIILIDGAKFDSQLVTRIINTLKHYPKHSIVKVNHNSSLYRVVDDHKLVSKLTSDESVSIQIDAEDTIDQFLYWDYEYYELEQEKIEWEQYIQSVLSGNQWAALKWYEKLTDGLCVEEIFERIVSKTIVDISECQGISESLKLVGYQTIQDLVTLKSVHYMRDQQSKGNILLTNIGCDQHTLGLKLVADTLRVNGWEVHLCLTEQSLEDLLDYTEQLNITMVGFSVTMHEQVELLHDYAKRLKMLNPALTLFAGGQSIKEGIIPEIDYVIKDLSQLSMKLETSV